MGINTKNTVVLWFQPAQEDRREDQDPDQDQDLENRDLEVKEGEEQVEHSHTDEKKENRKVKADKEITGVQKTARRPRNSMLCKVSLLDETTYECSVDVSFFYLFGKTH